MMFPFGFSSSGFGLHDLIFDHILIYHIKGFLQFFFCQCNHSPDKSIPYYGARAMVK